MSVDRSEKAMTASAESGELIPAFPARAQRPFQGWLLRPPGVYRPQADTCLLAGAVRDAGIPSGARVLDLCTGTGALAVTAASEGAGSVTAVDVSRRALLATWINATARRLPVRVCRGGLPAGAAGGPYDVVIANPPYVPSPTPAVRSSRAWDAGADGRTFLDPLCERAPVLLAPGGFLLHVHSAVSDVDKSLTRLRAGGLAASVVARARVPFGPVMRERIGFLEAAGMIERGQRLEDLVVIRADRR
jgi:release factor glutamine methyltransferase